MHQLKASLFRERVGHVGRRSGQSGGGTASVLVEAVVHFSGSASVPILIDIGWDG